MERKKQFWKAAVLVFVILVSLYYFPALKHNVAKSSAETPIKISKYAIIG